MADVRPEDIEGSKAPLLEHLIELRNRLMWAVIALFIAFIGCYLVIAPSGIPVTPLVFAGGAVFDVP